MALLILAPHFDDAVYSCGALLARRVMKGEAVTLMTICGAAIPANPPQNRFVQELHARWRAANGGVWPDRQAEERLAARALSPEGWTRVLALPYLDAIYRRDGAGEALYTSGAQLNREPHPEDPLPAEWNASDWLDGADFDELYFPLTVGGHVDHRIVRDGALAWWAGKPAAPAYACRAFAYADFPYSRHEAAIADALARFPAVGTLQQCPPVLATEAELGLKIAAMRAYPSQNSSFWEDDEAMMAEVRAAPEIYWQLCH